VVLISGSGSNLQAVLDACAAGTLDAQVAAVISDQPGAYGLQRARRAGVPVIPFHKPRGIDRHAYDLGLATLVTALNPDWVLLLGWMRLLTSAFLDRFPGKVVNLHPALPGTFAGTHAIVRTYAAYQAGQTAHAGVMVHLVPDEGVDCGPVLGQERVPIYPEDDLPALEARIHETEHRLVVSVLQNLTLTRLQTLSSFSDRDPGNTRRCSPTET
jgi:formyltetrahydrofolate-dependent phosphoribosylglycinamide formyltransferase